MDDPVEDRTITVVTPNSVAEQNMVVWLVQKKSVSPQQKLYSFIQMDDDLVNEYAALAGDDDDNDHQ
jgi:hypothetical protein